MRYEKDQFVNNLTVELFDNEDKKWLDYDEIISRLNEQDKEIKNLKKLINDDDINEED